MGANSRANASGKMNDQLDYGTIEGFEILPWLETAGCEATPVASFLHSHLSWRFNHNMHEGLIVEASYKDENGTTAFWLAIVTKVFGYYLKLRWLGDTPKASTFWKVVGLYKPPVEGRSDDRIFHVGYAVSNQKQFKAPRSVPKPQQGWRRFLAEHLESAAALTENIQNNIEKEIESPLSIGQKAEAMDITNILAVAPVIVEENRGGRLKLCYADRRRNPGRDSETWLHKFSPEILPPGMATIVGMAITSTAEYYEESWKHTVEEWLTGSIGNFPRRFVPDFLERELRAHRFNEGAKLEVLDMLAPDKIRVGTILEVLDDFWLNIKIECASSGKSKDYVVCLHATSDRLLPAGWAVDNGFKDYFLPPRGFSWDNCEKVPPELLQRKISSHAFMPQQLLEVIGVARTNLIYIAQIKAVKEPLMLVRYFGWEPEEYAFFPISSLDIYPVGWCDSVRHRLQAPRKNMEPMRF